MKYLHRCEEVNEGTEIVEKLLDEWSNRGWEAFAFELIEPPYRRLVWLRRSAD